MAITKLIADSITSGAIASTPAFLAYCNTQQSISHATNTKIGYDTELLDTDNAYNSSNSTFTVPSGKAGVYAFFMNVSLHDFSTNEAKRVMVRLYKNGSTQIAFFGEHQKAGDGSAGHRTSAFTMLDLSVGDTIIFTNKLGQVKTIKV